ncbi:MAG TPA: tetratricopeptide repeat protein [Polyangia bacterium]|nr:tetratricopeptide repeat protein [Polyangia bacterium]
MSLEALAEARLELGERLRREGRIDEAIEAYRAAVAREPASADTHHALASLLGRHGLREESRAHYLEALRLAPGDPVVHSSLLYLDGYDPALDAVAALRDHVWWDRLHGRGLLPWAPHANRPDPERRLRVGYVSPDLRAHPVARFMLPIYEAHDRARVEVVSYARVARLDAIGERFRAASDRWRGTAGLDDEALARQVRADEIDVLVDLSGHTGGNFLGAFSRRPAPVQVSYLGYPRTTGVAAIGYRLTDGVCDPPGEPSAHSEELVRLPGAWCCWEPQPAPEVAPPPCLGKGHVTFGSLHNVLKINDDVLDVWARVLAAVPRSRLLIRRNTLIGATRERFLSRLVSRGVAPDRVDLGTASVDGFGHLRTYAEIDLSLDTLPWSAHTTTCESLWMGVPMLTQRGSRAAGRQSASVLEAVGLRELVAESADELVRLAAAWAGAPARLAECRGRLREQVRRSPLCDGPAFTRGLEGVYRALWRRWCASTR